jgi:hypothetical protein
MKMTGLFSEIGRVLKRSLWHTEESSIYIYDLDQTDNSSDLRPMNRDHIPDLLAYRPLEAWQPPINKFLKLAMRNLETGHHVYTQVENERLAQIAWLTVPKNLNPASEDQWYSLLPPESAVISDYFMHSRDSSLTLASLCQILRDATQIEGVKYAYICVPADNLSLKRAVEEVGFTYLYSFFKRKVLGKVTRLSKTPEPLIDPGGKTARVITRILITVALLPW